ncbi:MAG: flagellar protein FlaG [Campylobacterota bacterium]|nr:flagellar protein FlaG [Campylobacterota bacterium]
MDGIANVARQQQTQVSSMEVQGRVPEQIDQMQTQKNDVVEQIQKEVSQEPKINSKEQVEDLVKQLNSAMAPMNTNLRFGVDRDDIFYVSVVETETSKMIRRFPAEQAADFLPKMQEVTGILFDSKG